MKSLRVHLLASLVVLGAALAWYASTPSDRTPGSATAGMSTNPFAAAETASAPAEPAHEPPVQAAAGDSTNGASEPRASVSPEAIRKDQRGEIERAHDDSALEIAARAKRIKEQTAVRRKPRISVVRFIAPTPGNPDLETEWQMLLPPGARLPAAILDQDKELTPAQALALDRVTEEFLNDDVPESSQGTGATQPIPGPVKKSERALWDARKDRADERYRALFGDDAYNQMLLSAGRAALETE